jgi:exodeoxyribonuclease VII small subunit
MPKEKFEDALSKLEKIVGQLEEGDISLEESLKLFEEGIRLSRLCNQKLDEAERKVQILVKDREGNVKAEPFSPALNSGESVRARSGQHDEEDAEGPSGED